jgi:putative DNA primase/helicase
MNKSPRGSKPTSDWSPFAALQSNGIFLNKTEAGQHYTTCPQCSFKRSTAAKQKAQCLGVGVTATSVGWGCYNCGWTGGASQRNGTSYEYADEKGETWLRKVRGSDKGGEKFFYWQRASGGEWETGLDGRKPALYRLAEVREAIAAGRTIVCVEGEKDADNLWNLGIPATSSPHGAAKDGQRSKWLRQYSEMLRGADIVVMGDNDPPGRRHLRDAAQLSSGIAASVRTIDIGAAWPECPEKGDISDWLAGGLTADQLEELIQGAEVFTPDPTEVERANGELPAGSVLNSTAASTITIKSIRWVWPNRYARGKIGLLVGHPDRGKSQITAWMAACITTGGQWPCGEGRAPKGRVLILSAEDDSGDTIVPRLMAAGADCSLVEIVQMVTTEKDGPRMVNLLSDLKMIRDKIDQFGDVVMIVVDPVSAYLGVGKVDSYRTTDVRGILAPLKELAEEKRLLVLGVLHFNKKVDVNNAMLRVSDSLAFAAAGRHVFAVVDDTENERRLFIKAKNNLAPDTRTLSYTMEVVPVGQDAEDGTMISAPRIKWGDQYVEITATEAMEAENAGRPPKAREQAAELLTDMLGAGPVAQKEIEQAAKAQKIALRTLRRAKETIGIISKWDRKGRFWVWENPAKVEDTKPGEIPF